MRITAAFVTAIGITGLAQAQFPIDANFDGNTEFNGWEDLTIFNPQIASAEPAFPGFPGSAPWPEPIESDAPGSGDAQFDKVSGNGYPASISIYSSPFGNGTYSVTDATPLQDVQNIAFQIVIGAGSGGFLDGSPTLTINGDTLVDFSIESILNTSSEPNPFLGGQILPVATILYQWDLTDLGPIDSFEINFTTSGTSTTIQALQLDQSDAPFAQIPAPSAVAVFGLASLTACRRRRG